MKFQCCVVAASLMVAESGLIGSVFGSQSTRLGLEASAGFLRSTRKAADGRLDNSAAETVGAAVNQDMPDDAVNLMQQEAVQIKKGSNPARIPDDLLGAAKKLEEPQVEPLNSDILSGSKAAANSTEKDPSRYSASKKWDEIKNAQDDSKKAAAEGAALANDDSVKHLMSWEAMLIQNIATGDDEHAQGCIAHCRYGEEVRHSWEECVERCVEDGMTRRMLMVGLPESERAAVHKDAPVPAGIDELKKKRTQRRRARSEDL
jgi:hypothetical protein